MLEFGDYDGCGPISFHRYNNNFEELEEKEKKKEEEKIEINQEINERPVTKGYVKIEITDTGSYERS